MSLAEIYATAALNSSIREAEAKGEAKERVALGAKAEELKKKGKSAEEILSILFPKTANITVS